MTTSHKLSFLVALLVFAAVAVQAQTPSTGAVERKVEGVNPFTGKYFSVEALEQERQSKALEAQIAQSRASIAQARVQEQEATDKLKRGVTAVPASSISTPIAPAPARSPETTVPAKPQRTVTAPRKANASAPALAPSIAPVTAAPPVVSSVQVPGFEVGSIRFADGREVRLQERGTTVAMVDRDGVPLRVDRAATIAVDTRPSQPPVVGSSTASPDATRGVPQAPASVSGIQQNSGPMERPGNALSESLISPASASTSPK